MRAAPHKFVAITALAFALLAPVGPIALASREATKTKVTTFAAKVATVAKVAKGSKQRGRLFTAKQASHFIDHELVLRERNYFKAGVAWDAKTGMSLDAHPIDTLTGKLRGKPRFWSAASKESLHIILLLKALDGDQTAQRLLAPDPTKPASAVAAALDVLQRKINTYQRFDREHPGYGGFLPWYNIKNGTMTPDAAWRDKVPGLDNGQLAWSIYRAVDVLDRNGHTELADQYRAQLALMKQNVVRMFYDPTTKKMRTEVGLAAHRSPSENEYKNEQPNRFLDDPYEGLMLCHFADLMGDWSHHAEGKELIWQTPRRVPDVYKRGDKRITVVQGEKSSGHEDWGFLVLPYRDVPVADRLFLNEQTARTWHSATHGYSGLIAATNEPTALGAEAGGYLNTLGIPGISKDRVSRRRVFAPYAASSLALSHKRVFASWMKNMSEVPHMLTEYGMGESYSGGGKKIAPLLTWDGKALPLIAWMGGIGPEIAAQLKRDGLYKAFFARVKADYGKFDGMKIEGARLRPAAPPMQ